jgi:hypothetical protein
MAHKEWEAILQDWRKVPAGKSDQSAKPSGIRSNDQGKASGEEGRKAVRSTTQEHCEEDSGV